MIPELILDQKVFFYLHSNEQPPPSVPVAMLPKSGAAQLVCTLVSIDLQKSSRSPATQLLWTPVAMAPVLVTTQLLWAPVAMAPLLGTTQLLWPLLPWRRCWVPPSCSGTLLTWRCCWAPPSCSGPLWTAPDQNCYCSAHQPQSSSRNPVLPQTTAEPPAW